LALRQGELDGAGNTKDSFMDQLGDLWKSKKIVVLVQTGTPGEGKRDPDFPDAPTVTELAQTPNARKIAESTALLATLGRPFWLPPGVPKKRVKLLRDAFWNCMQDEKLRKEAKRLGRPIRAQRGEALQETWKKAIDAPPAAVKIVKDIFRR
jgi:tripartite-type tricarboxylate transporter receptor subunit TctC